MPVLYAKIANVWTPINFATPPEVFIGSTTPSGNETMWIDTSTNPPTTKAFVGGAWVTVGAVAPNEVFVGPNDPLPTDPQTELWYDTDAPAPPTPSPLFQIYPNTAALNAVTGSNGQLASVANTFRLFMWVVNKWVIVAGGMPRFQLRNSIAGPSAATGAVTTVTWDQELIDTDGLHAPNAGGIVIPAGLAGRWRFDACVSFAANATGIRSLWLDYPAGNRRFGEVDMVTNGGAFGTTISTSAEIELAVGETVFCSVFHNAGVALNLNGNVNINFFGGQYVGPGF